MKSFKSFVSEENMAGDGGVFGSSPSMNHGGAVGNTDFYAPGDSRAFWSLGMTSRLKAKKRKKRKKNNTSK